MAEGHVGHVLPTHSNCTRTKQLFVLCGLVPLHLYCGVHLKLLWRQNTRPLPLECGARPKAVCLGADSKSTHEIVPTSNFVGFILLRHDTMKKASALLLWHLFMFAKGTKLNVTLNQRQIHLGNDCCYKLRRGFHAICDITKLVTGSART